jgi:hypothetical protein
MRWHPLDQTGYFSAAGGSAYWPGNAIIGAGSAALPDRASAAATAAAAPIPRTIVVFTRHA